MSETSGSSERVDINGDPDADAKGAPAAGEVEVGEKKGAVTKGREDKLGWLGGVGRVDPSAQGAVTLAGITGNTGDKPKMGVPARSTSGAHPVNRAEQLQMMWRSDFGEMEGGGLKQRLYRKAVHSRSTETDAVPHFQSRRKSGKVADKRMLVAASAMLTGDDAVPRGQGQKSTAQPLTGGGGGAAVVTCSSTRGNSADINSSRKPTAPRSVEQRAASVAKKVPVSPEKGEGKPQVPGVMRVVCGSVRGVAAAGKYTVLGVKYGFSDSARLIRKAANKFCPPRS